MAVFGIFIVCDLNDNCFLFSYRQCSLHVTTFQSLQHTAAHPSHEVHDHPHEAAPSPCDDPPKHDVQDMFCPDSQYRTVRQSIPQLDGSTDAFQCDNCHKFFQIRDQLADHSKIHQFGCDDCGICYIWLYILAATTQKHPSSFHQA